MCKEGSIRSWCWIDVAPGSGTHWLPTCKYRGAAIATLFLSAIKYNENSGAYPRSVNRIDIKSQ